MSKYKVGDKVKVKEGLIPGKHYGADVFIEKMMGIKTVTIKAIRDSKYVVKGTLWSYTDEMLDGLVESKSKSKKEPKAKKEPTIETKVEKPAQGLKFAVGDTVSFVGPGRAEGRSGRIVQVDSIEPIQSGLPYLVDFGHKFDGHDGSVGSRTGYKHPTDTCYWCEESELAYEGVDSPSFKPIDTCEKTEFSTGAVRDTAVGKPSMDLIPWDLMGRVGLHYGKGADKYGKDNWRKGQKKSHTFASLIRHAMAYWIGKTDEDHLSAIIWNAFSLMLVDTYFQDNNDLNDLNEDSK